MPVDTYTCASCSYTGDYLHKMGEDPSSCTHCGSDKGLTKHLAAPSVHTGGKSNGGGKTTIIARELPGGITVVSRKSADSVTVCTSSDGNYFRGAHAVNLGTSDIEGEVRRANREVRKAIKGL